MSLLALDGEVDNRDETIEKLRSENRRLTEELRVSKLALETARSENGAVMEGVKEIRNLLTPLYRGLRLTFGELDALPIPNTMSPAVNGPSIVANPKLVIWQKWIDKFGSDSLNGKMITTLLEHGQMSTDQLRVAMQCSGQSVINAYNRLLKHGLISKSGGKYSLREL
jgi:hypothetical protein